MKPLTKITAAISIILILSLSMTSCSLFIENGNFVGLEKILSLILDEQPQEYSEGIELCPIPDSTNYAVVGIGSCTESGITLPGYAIDENGKGHTVSEIASYAFIENKEIISVSMLEGISCIGVDAFCACSNLTQVELPSTLDKIDCRAFYWCSLGSITIPSGTTTIGDYAFTNNVLSSVTIPSSVNYIGEGAFQYNDALRVVIFEGTIEEWNRISIGNNAFSDDVTVSTTNGIIMANH